jgi:radical SAM superfamily enzyme YgiQ (UPF0313 family)
VRTLSAVLKSADIETQMVWMPTKGEGISWTRGGFLFAYSEKVLYQVAELTRDSDLIGISLMSNYFVSAIQITQHLRHSIDAPIIWGGVHPTVRPEECLAYADLICMGEGEDALLELVLQLRKGDGSKGIRNIWYKENGEIVRTPLRHLSTELDEIPYPDYDLNAEFLLVQGDIRPLTRELFLLELEQYSSRFGIAYHTLISRGCYYKCTYCVNNAMKNIYGKEWKVRRRSVDNFIGEAE